MPGKHWPEALASLFVVGLGQIVKGEGDKGLKMMLIFYLAMPASLYAALLISGYLFLLALALVMICGTGTSSVTQMVESGAFIYRGRWFESSLKK